MTLVARLSLSLAVACLLVAAALSLADHALTISLVLGAGFGITLQRSRFCFLCNLRDFVAGGDPRGVLAILVALAVGAAGYAAVFGAWMPVPSPDRLPPDAHVGPVSLTLGLAAAVFGLGMAISGSCLSGHLYRLGEGAPIAPFALLGALIGFGLGFLSWNTLYVADVATARPWWLPHHAGYAGTLAATIAVLAALALLVLHRARPPAGGQAVTAGPLPAALRAVFVDRWPAAVGGILVGAIGTIAYFRVAPLGVTAEIGSISRTVAAHGGLIPETLFGLDGLRGCATVVKQALLSKNGVFVLALVGGSFAAALAAGQFRPRLPTAGEAVRGLAGGVLMGWGAMTALGCTVGVLLSGIQAGALSGWVFLVFCTLGAVLGLHVIQRRARGT